MAEQPQKIQIPYGLNLRDYQEPVWEHFIDIRPNLRGIQIWPRRNGKDLVDWNICIAKALQEVGLYFYMAPYYNQVRQIIWEGFDGKGRKFLDYIHPDLLRRKTQVDMRIELINGSQIKLCGSDNIDAIVGTNPRGIVFTEFSLHKPQAWEYLRPILAENGGWALFNGTPRGLNHFYELYQKANKSDKWFVQYLNRNDTGVPTLEAIDEDIKSGMPDALVQQEYYCSFMSGVQGSYYADLLAEIREKGHMTKLPWEPKLQVYTGWDLGMHDSTAIWFAQVHGFEVRLIDYYERNGKGLGHYIKVLKEKPYVYAEHFAPHDIEVRELSSGRTRRDIAMDMGLDFTTTPRHSLEDGHDLVRELIPRCWFDATQTTEGVSALMAYHKSFNDRTQAFSDKPQRNWAKHGADAFRILAHNVDALEGEHAFRFRKPTVHGSLNYGKGRTHGQHVAQSQVRFG